jgi:hypothetical protein
MSWNEANPADRDIIACVKAADRVPRLPIAFRHRVLDEALKVRQRAVSLHRIQALTTSLLAASLLLVLPGLYRQWQNPGGWPAPTAVTGNWTTVVPTPLVGTADAFEWSLVQSQLADRSESLRILRGAL